MACLQEWKDECAGKIEAILRDEQTHSAFAQLFDGSPIETTSLLMYGIESCFAGLPYVVTPQATAFVAAWLAEQVTLVMPFVCRTLDGAHVLGFQPEAPRETTLAFLTHCVVQPFIRNRVRAFCNLRKQLQVFCNLRALSAVCFQRPRRLGDTEIDTEIEAMQDWAEEVKVMQDWAEEVMFGGLLHCELGRVGLQLPFRSSMLANN